MFCIVIYCVVAILVLTDAAVGLIVPEKIGNSDQFVTDTQYPSFETESSF